MSDSTVLVTLLSLGAAMQKSARAQAAKQGFKF